MTFFKWLCSLFLILLFIGVIFKMGLTFINMLLLICAFVFIIDTAFIGKKRF